MNFLERIRNILLEKNFQEIEDIEKEIKDTDRKYSNGSGNIQELKEESQTVTKTTTDFQRTIIDPKELEDLKTIYDFLSNYQVIKKVLHKIKNIQLPEANPKYIHVLKKLNLEIARIINGQEEPNNSETEKENFFSRLLGKRKREVANDEKLFKKFEKIIKEFKQKHESFPVANFSDFRKKEFFEDDQLYEFWQEVSNYYANISVIGEIVRKFGENFEKYKRLYEEQPELFDLNNLARIFREHNQNIISLRDRQKNVENKQKQVVRQRESERELKKKLGELEKKKRELEEKREKIKNAGTLHELGFRNKEEAVKRLSLQSKDYLVISIPNTVIKISDLFRREKQLKIKVGGRTFFGMYSNDVVEARINSLVTEENTGSCLLIPISELRTQDIDSIDSGKIFLNKSVLQLKNILFIAPKGRPINFEYAKVESYNYTNGTILDYVRRFLGEDFLVDSDGISDYDIFEGIPNISLREKQNKKEAIQNSLARNIKRDVVSTDPILVDGEPYILNLDDECKISEAGRRKPLNEEFLYGISDEIEAYLICEENNGPKIDELYTRLLLEYMRIRPKLRADYYIEDDTTINIKGRNFSIKPILPAKDEKVAKRYSRSSEDVVYKTMKLSALLNKFAHLDNSKELQERLYIVKLDLIERVIDLAKNNPKVKLSRIFDHEKRANAVVLEIPGYNIISLHLMNRSDDLSYKSNSLEERNMPVVQTSIIHMPGVNKDFLNAMKSMSEEERMEALLSLKLETFLKLILRMGYTSDNVSTMEKRKEFIKSIISGEKIDELIREIEEIERD